MKSLEELIELFISEKANHVELSPAEFAARFPEQESELLELLEMVDLLDQQAPENPPPPLPESLKGFKLEAKIGQGGMGVVFRARQELLDRPVAIKLLAPALALDPQRRQNFENEARLVARLHHPNIIQVFGAGYEAPYSYFVMELIDAHPLSLTRRYTSCEIAQIGVQIASALSYAHSQNILHRDIKPGNILMDAQNQVHLGDFGLAAGLSGAEALTLTQGTPEGTLRYMAPEIFLQNHYSFASDQYALGITLYELWTGRPAFAAPAPGQLIRQICEHQLPALPGRTSELATIINQATAALPEARYANLAALEADLQRFLHHEPIRARHYHWWSQLKLAYHRNPWAVIFSTLTVVLLLAVGVISSWGYFMVSRALDREAQQRQLAETNAQLARETLERIYSRQPGSAALGLRLGASPEALALLEELWPYYEKVHPHPDAAQSQQFAQLQQNLADLAWQADRGALAERLYAAILERTPPESALGVQLQDRRAQALRQQGKSRQAQAIWENLEKIPPSAQLDRELALLAASRHGAQFQQRREQKATWRRIAARLKKIAPEARQRPDFQLLQAQLLIDAPELGRRYRLNANPFELLKQLQKNTPDDREIQRELLRAGLKLKLPERRGYKKNLAHLQLALQAAENLLATSGSDPQCITAVAQLYEKYLNYVRNRGEVLKQSNRIIGMMKLLAAGTHNSENARQAALKFLLQQYRQLTPPRPQKSNYARQELKAEIEKLIQAYPGPQRAQFLRELKKIEKNSQK